MLKNKQKPEGRAIFQGNNMNSNCKKKAVLNPIKNTYR